MPKIAIALLATILLLSLAGRAFADVHHEAYTPLENASTCAHTNVETQGSKDATCVAEGHTGNIYCTDCGELITGGSAIPATGEHKFSDWVSNEDLSCRTCIVCSYEEVQHHPASGNPDPEPNRTAIGIVIAVVLVTAGGGTAAFIILKKKKH